jgi:hypothetical protein
MKKLLLISGVLLAFCASSAMANGQIHLAVNDCGGAAAINNACTTNSGSFILVGSFVSDQASSQVIAIESIVDLAQAGAVSDWWRVDPAGCRAGKITASFAFPTTVCNDLFAGAALGGLGILYPGTGSGLIPTNSERIDIYCAVDATTPLTIDTATENTIFNMAIARAGTLGGAACGGCGTGTALYLNDVAVGQEPGSPTFHDSGDGNGQSCSYNGGNTPTPTKSSSWGSIKALYR